MRRVSSAATVATLLVLVLAGCDPVTDVRAPIAISEHDSAITLAACEEVAVDRFTLEVRDSPFGSQWQSLVDWDGRWNLASGEVFDLDEVPEGMDGLPLGRVELAPGATISVYFRVLLPTDRVDIATEFVVPKDGLPSSDWLAPDGRVMSKPCDD